MYTMHDVYKYIYVHDINFFISDGHTQCCYSVTTAIYTCTCAAHRNSGLVDSYLLLRMEGEVLGGMWGLKGAHVV